MKLNTIACLIACSAVLSGSVFAEDIVSGGTIKFSGSITESACSILAGSENQAVEMGDVSVSAITSNTSPVSLFSIGLTGCNDAVKKALTVTFATANPIEGLLALESDSESGDGDPVSGAGIQIRNGNDNTDVAMNTATAPINFLAGTNTLNFKAYLKPIGVAGSYNVVPGKFKAVTTFAVNYQ